MYPSNCLGLPRREEEPAARMTRPQRLIMPLEGEPPGEDALPVKGKLPDISSMADNQVRLTF